MTTIFLSLEHSILAGNINPCTILTENFLLIILKFIQIPFNIFNPWVFFVWFVKTWCKIFKSSNFQSEIFSKSLLFVSKKNFNKIWSFILVCQSINSVPNRLQINELSMRHSQDERETEDISPKILYWGTNNPPSRLLNQFSPIRPIWLSYLASRLHICPSI